MTTEEFKNSINKLISKYVESLEGKDILYNTRDILEEITDDMDTYADERVTLELTPENSELRPEMIHDIVDEDLSDLESAGGTEEDLDNAISMWEDMDNVCDMNDCIMDYRVRSLGMGSYSGALIIKGSRNDIFNTIIDLDKVWNQNADSAMWLFADGGPSTSAMKEMILD